MRADSTCVSRLSKCMHGLFEDFVAGVLPLCGRRMQMPRQLSASVTMVWVADTMYSRALGFCCQLAVNPEVEKRRF